MKVNRAQYNELIEKLATYQDSLEDLGPNKILSTAKLLNETAESIIHYNPVIGEFIKHEANKLLDFGNMDNPDAVQYFNEGAFVLNKGIEDFISTLEILE